MALTLESKNKMLDHLMKSTPLYVAGLTSLSEADAILTGRKPIEFTDAVDGITTGNSLEPLTISAGTTIVSVALYTDVTAGELLGIFELTLPETYANEGSLSVNNLTISLV